MLRIGWFSTGRGDGSRGLLEFVQQSIQRGELDAAVEFVFCNRELGEAEGSDRFHDLVRSYGLPLIALSSRRYRREHGGGGFSRHRGPFHREVVRALTSYHMDVGVLAAYMLITSPEMVRRYPLINLHPALPSGSAGTWQQVIWKIIESGAARTGATVHVATEVLDAGPVVAFCSFPIRGRPFDPLWAIAEGRPIDQLKADGEEQPLFAAIRREGVRRERPLLLEAIKLLAEGQVRVRDGDVVDADGRPARGVDLTPRVEAYLRNTSGGD